MANTSDLQENMHEASANMAFPAVHGIRAAYARRITGRREPVRSGAGERNAHLLASLRPASLIRHYNEKKNAAFPPFTGLIGRQSGGGPADDLRYGLFRMSFNGCEVIAVYNLLNYLGCRKDIREVSGDLEEDGMALFGGFGTRPDAMRDYLNRILTEERRTGGLYAKYKARAELFLAKDMERYDALIDRAGAGILTFWNGERKWTIHTVMLHKTEKGGIRVYNQYTNVLYNEYASAEHFLMNQGKPFLPISLIVIQR